MKSNKGFTLIEIIVVLVILAILAAATIPSMLGFVQDAKRKAMLAEVREISLAVQAYVTEQYGSGTITNDETLAANINGDITTNPQLSGVLNGDIKGTVSNVVIENGKVKGFNYKQDGGAITARYEDGKAVTFANDSTVNNNQGGSSEPSSEPSPTPSPTPNPFDLGNMDFGNFGSVPSVDLVLS